MWKFSPRWMYDLSPNTLNVSQALVTMKCVSSHSLELAPQHTPRVTTDHKPIVCNLPRCKMRGSTSAGSSPLRRQRELTPTLYSLYISSMTFWRHYLHPFVTLVFATWDDQSCQDWTFCAMTVANCSVLSRWDDVLWDILCHDGFQLLSPVKMGRFVPWRLPIAQSCQDGTFCAMTVANCSVLSTGPFCRRSCFLSS